MLSKCFTCFSLLFILFQLYSYSKLAYFCLEQECGFYCYNSHYCYIFNDNFSQRTFTGVHTLTIPPSGKHKCLAICVVIKVFRVLRIWLILMVSKHPRLIL